MKELKVYVPQDGPYGLEPEEGGELVTHNEGKILQQQIYVCQFCRENARQMLQIKKFATETNLKVEIKGLNNGNLR